MKYSINQGDTLSKIAKTNGLTLDQLLNANPQFKESPDKIKIGDIIEIPGAQAQAGEATEKTTHPQTAKKAILLGSLSSKYETGGRGCGTVSSGSGDTGGVSYGSYQMSSKLGVAQKFIAQPDFKFRNEFENLVPGTKEFSDKWKEIAASHPDEFQDCQHEYIKKTHFDILVERIKKDTGLDIITRSQALQNVVWSTAVHHGPFNSIIHKAVAAVSVPPDNSEYEKELIHAIYAERGRRDANGNLAHFSKNSADVQKGVANRFKNEETDALKMLQEELVV
jgi:LysM repeat protein